MDATVLRAIVEHLQGLVAVVASGDSAKVSFDVPSEASMVAAGLDPDGVRRILGEPWWDEMVEDVLATPDFCEPDDPPEQVLAFARDVVFEYVAKRFKP